MTRSSQKIKSGNRLGRSKLPDTSEVNLLKVLSSPEQYSKFHQICNNNIDIFGSRGSDLRRKIQYRKKNLDKLRTQNPAKFQELLQQRGIVEQTNPAQQDQIPSYSSEESDSESDPESDSESESITVSKPSNEPTHQVVTSSTRALKQVKNMSPSVNKNQNVEYEVEHELNLFHPSFNPEGIIPLYTEKAVTSDKHYLCGKIGIYILCPDIRDFIKSVTVLLSMKATMV